MYIYRKFWQVYIRTYFLAASSYLFMGFSLPSFVTKQRCTQTTRARPTPSGIACQESTVDQYTLTKQSITLLKQSDC